MALELVGGVFALLRKMHQIATEAQVNLDKVKTELDTNDGARPPAAATRPKRPASDVGA